MNVYKENLKNFWDSCKLPQAHKKVCNENETKKAEKTKEAVYKLHMKNWQNNLN